MAAALVLLLSTPGLQHSHHAPALQRRPGGLPPVHGLARREALRTFGGVLLASTIAPLAAPAAAAEEPKLRGLTDAQLKKRLLTDITEHRFMVTGKLSKELYADTAKFTDEIDTYDLESYVRGTGQLFDGDRSEFKLVGDVDISGKTVRYKFDEILSFRIPLQPRSRVSGVVELTRGDDGLIEKYREYWDQSVPATLVDLVLDGIGLKRAAFVE
jgi:hypothetical protein